MREEIEKVLEAMREDYKRWSDNCMRSGFETPDSSDWNSSVQEDISALEGYLMKMDIL